MTDHRYSGLGGFPPTRTFLLVPRRPVRATAASLALYEAVEPRQRAVLSAARLAVALRLGRLLPTVVRPAALDPEWWDAWLATVARPAVGDIGCMAFRVPPNGRVAALLMDRGGAPIGFVKQLSRPATPLDAQISRLLQATELPFATPAVVAEGSFEGVSYRLYEPLPAGAHFRPPADPERVRAVLDAWQACLTNLPRPPGAANQVMCHADFTPRNLRVASDRRWWLIDWDNARWGPRLADELHYWCAEYSWRLRPRIEHDAPRVLALLRQRGTDREIAAAAKWPDAPARTYRATERQLRAAVGSLAAEEAARLG